MQALSRHKAKTRRFDGRNGDGRYGPSINKIDAGPNDTCEGAQETGSLPRDHGRPNSPVAHARSGDGKEVIRFAIGQGSLGSILIALSDKGVCAILLGDHVRALAAELHTRFSKAKLIASNSGFKEVVAKVVRAVDAPDSTLDLSLDLRGTELQQRVWHALREIPTGSTATYKEIARRVGMSATPQDVAEACGANALAVVVPCHRVTRSDGSLAGYRWGIKRKRALLQKEQEAAPEPGSLFHAAALAAH